MAWQYLIVCSWDFMLAPIAASLFAYWTNTPVITWTPLTLQGGGVYHLSMGAIVGVTSWSRTKEKITAAAAKAEQQPTS